MSAPVRQDFGRLDLADPSTFPSRRVEAWRWSDLRRILREAPPPSPAIAVEPGGPFAALGGAEIAFGNGRLTRLSANGVRSGEEQARQPIDAKVGAFPGSHEPGKALADGSSEVAFNGTGVLRLRFVTDATGTGHQAAATIAVPEDGELLVLETHEGAGSAYAANVRLTFEAADGARLTRIVLLDDVADAIAVEIAEVTRLGIGARFEQTVLTSGARLQRNETRVRHPGRQALVRLDGLYVLDGERHADLTTGVDHEGVGGETRQLTKGVVKDRARGVFQGRITVAPGADQTDARMGHHALMLSDHAEIDAKPELEIFADEVACAHGNTIGALDEDALFYARARGMPEAEARALLTVAFLGEVIDAIEAEPVREIAQAWLSARLGVEKTA